MNLFITDSVDLYDKNVGDKKILIGQLKDLTLTAIINTNFMDEKLRSTINDLFLTYNLKHSERVVERLEEFKLAFTSSKIYANKVLKERSDNIISDALLHNSFREQLVRRYAMGNLKTILSQYLPEIGSFEACLSEEYSLVQELVDNDFQVTIYKSKNWKKLTIPFIKSLLYRLFKFRNVVKPSKQERWLFFLYDSIHHHELIRQVYQSSRIRNIQLVWVVINSGLNQLDKIKSLLPENSLIVKFDAFKETPSYRSLKFSNRLNQHAKYLNRRQAKLDLLMYEIRYAFMQRAVNEIKPSRCFHISYHEIGRALADVSKQNSIPSYSLDYSFITDDFRFDKGIQFDHKFVPSQNQARIWNRRNDPSQKHHVVGFPKYEEGLVKSFDQKTDRLNHNIPAGRVVLLASSYGFDNSIREFQLTTLMDICTEKKWTLIVKKHPLEVDNLVERVISEKGNDQIIVFSHTDISAMEAISISDVTVSSGSSIVMDCLLIGRPFISLSMNSTSSFSDIMPVCSEIFVRTTSSRDDLAQAIEQLTDSNIDYTQIRKSYLGPLDGNSSKRMLDLMLANDPV